MSAPDIHPTIEQLYELLDRANDGFWIWYFEDGEPTEREYLSRRLCSMLGHEQLPHSTASWQDLIHPEDLQEAYRQFSDHVHHGAPYAVRARYRYKGRPGYPVVVLCRGEVVRDEAGTPQYMVGVHTDITKLVEAEQAALRNGRLAADMSKALSHDLRAPARRSRMAAETALEMLDEGDRAGAERMIRKVAINSDVAEGLSDALLRLGRADAQAPDVTRVDVTEMVRSIASFISEDLPRPVCIDIAADMEVWADEELLRVVLLNLLDNACKYVGQREQPQVWVSYEAGEIVVEDNGAGFPPVKAREIFEPFKRTHDARRFKGHGIGLTIVARAVERMGGEVRAESGGEGRGATFRVRLPGTPEAPCGRYHDPIS